MRQFKRRGAIGTLLKPVLDLIGFFNSYSWCMKCKDSWWWKASNEASNQIGMFPICDECWGKTSSIEKHMYVTKLEREWRRAGLGIDQYHINKIKLAHKAIDTSIPYYLLSKMEIKE